MADIAAIFHWPASELWEMDFSEIVMWRALAAARAGKAKT